MLQNVQVLYICTNHLLQCRVVLFLIGVGVGRFVDSIYPSSKLLISSLRPKVCMQYWSTNFTSTCNTPSSSQKRAGAEVIVLELLIPYCLEQ